MFQELEDFDYSDIYKELMVKTPATLAEIAKLLDAAKWHEARQLTHKIRGELGNMGFEHCFNILTELESNLDSQNYNLNLRTYLTETQNAFNKGKEFVAIFL